VSLYQDRITVLSEISEMTDFYFVDPKSYSEEDLRKAKVNGDAFNALLEMKRLFGGIEWTVDQIERVVKGVVESRGGKLGDVVHPLRLVVTGRRATPGIFETLYYVGKQPVLRRIEHFLSSYRPPG
jgi:glutamyl/glutaminyl-tRNA synthetase